MVIMVFTIITIFVVILTVIKVLTMAVLVVIILNVLTISSSSSPSSPLSITWSYAALRAADLDWIVGPGYSSGGYILKKNHEKQTWNHENP